ncbi:MAG: trypsin-like serine protease [Gammaproteobacteria bacterium]|nr:trypsin-like serine protease [Gammaproteobacteria bacterium]MCF6261740.1 trypsin-like serine protease [Gammaproteobacteria bacterium]
MTKPSRSPGNKTPDNTNLYRKAGLFLLTLLLLVGFLTSALAKPVPGITPRIIGGTNADPNEYPWAVTLLRANINGGFDATFCGGTLIASRWVLTAAHCVDDLSSASKIEVAIGINNLNNISNTDRQTVSHIFVHPAYNKTLSLNNDIALLELATPASNAVLNIADNNLTDDIATGELMTVIGWGTTSANLQAPIFPSLLQETQIPRFDFAACNTIYNGLLTDNMICAGFAAGGKDTCQGDSGGPILYFNTSDSTYYQTGVTSFGNGCAEANTPGVYTRAANYLDWVNNTMSTPLTGQRQFGYHGINRSASATLTLNNNSGENITISAVNLDNPTNFTLLSQSCTDTIIVNDNNCSITPQFQATNVGTHLATLSIDFGSGNPSINTTINGTGLATVNATGLDETPARLWYSGDNASWLNAFTNNSTGGTAMRSGNIGDNQNTALLAYFTGPDTLSFRWKASTEQDFDLLKLYINDVLIDAISGNQDWQQRNIALSAGEHRVVWVYEKDSTVSEFQDTVWLDSINTPFVSTPGTNPPPGGLGGGGGKLSGLFLLLLIVMLVLRKNLYRRQRISSDNKLYMANL